MDNDLELLAKQIDASCDAAELTRLIVCCETSLKDAQDTDRVYLNYFIANAYSGLSRIREEAEGPWDWNAREVIQEVFALRKAIAEPEFESSHCVLKCQIRTNLANTLSSLGRSVEAIEEYSKVLDIDNTFAKALGNRAYATTTYSWYLYDNGHQCLLLNSALSDYRRSLQPDAFWDTGFESSSADYFSQRMSEITAYLDGAEFDEKFDLSSFPMGDTHEEVEYRSWCLSDRLFLNPLNDVMEETIAANDILHLPPHAYLFKEEVRFPALYNILKQEYVTARYNLFASRVMDEHHMADRDVLLVDSFDYGQFDFRTEQLKLAFRSAYSIFDKIAVFLNDYFKVGDDEGSVNFRRIWGKQTKGGPIKLRCVFKGRENPPLRGLYYLAKDFFENGFSELASPDAQDIAKLRNFAEHKFLTLTDFGEHKFESKLHIHISRDEFEQKTMRLLKMARAALIYLSMAMQREEEIRKEDKIEGEATHEMPINSIPRR